jgi:hypothetical protein
MTRPQDESQEYAELYPLRERIWIAIRYVAVAAAIIFPFHFWLMPMWSEFAKNSHCRSVLGIHGIDIVFYGTLGVLPLLMGLSIGFLGVRHALQVLRGGQDPPIGVKVLRPTKIRRGRAARIGAYAYFAIPVFLVGLAVWGGLQAHALTADFSARQHPKCPAQAVSAGT